MKRRLLFSTALAWTALGVLPACAESPVQPLPRFRRPPTASVR